MKSHGTNTRKRNQNVGAFAIGNFIASADMRHTYYVKLRARQRNIFVPMRHAACRDRRPNGIHADEAVNIGFGVRYKKAVNMI